MALRVVLWQPTHSLALKPVPPERLPRRAARGLGTRSPHQPVLEIKTHLPLDSEHRCFGVDH